MAFWSVLVNFWRVIAFIVVPLACVPLPVFWETDSGKAAYILLVTSLFMVFEILPLPVTVLFSLFLIPATGVQTIAEASRAFTNDTFFLFISVLTLAISIEDTKLHNRIALLTLRAIGVSPSRLILGFILISGTLSMWMANTAVTVMILPIAMAVSDTLASPRKSISGDDQFHLTDKTNGNAVSATRQQTDTFLELADSENETFLADNNTAVEKDTAQGFRQSDADVRLSKSLQLCVAYGANIGGLATLIGSHPNMIFRMTLEKLYGTETGLNFLTYFMVCGPVAICSLFLTWIVLSLLYIPGWCNCLFKRQKPDPDTENAKHEEHRLQIIDQKIYELGPIRHAEISVLVIFCTVILLWLTRNPQVVPGWGNLLKPGFGTDSLPVILAAVLIFVWPSDFSELREGQYTPLMTWKRILVKLPWDLLLFSGGLAVVTNLTEVSGLTRSIGSLVPNLSTTPPWLVLTIICITASALTEVTNNSVIASIFVPVLANVAEDTGISPIYYMLAATMASMFSFMIPISSFPTIIVYGYGTVKMSDMIKAGIGPKVVCIIFLIFSLELLGWLVFDVKTFPDWAKGRLAARIGVIGTTNFSIDPCTTALY